MPSIRRATVWVAATLLAGQVAADQSQIATERAEVNVETVTDGLKVPWALSFLPGGDALLVERDAGRLHRLDVASGERREVSGLPDMLRSGEISAGLFDVRPHPNFADNRQLYLAYAEGDLESSGLVVDQMVLDGNRLHSPRRIFTAIPKTNGKWHFGGRLALTDQYLFISTGDGYEHSAQAQNLASHMGKIIRVDHAGGIPADNPFAGQPGALPEIFAYGVRNPQGMAVHPVTGALWINEHGPQGGDELNRVEAGINYGWPVITYGEEYGGGPIGDGITRNPGMAQPNYYWLPSIAPSGLAFYSGAVFEGWQGSAFSGALALKHINRLDVEGDRVLHEERLLEDRGWRVRFVEQGPDGYLYFGVDAGMVLRLVPAATASATAGGP